MGNARAQRKPTVQWAQEHVTCFLINLPPPPCIMYCRSLVKWWTQCSSFRLSLRESLPVFTSEPQASGLFYPNGMIDPSLNIFYGISNCQFEAVKLQMKSHLTAKTTMTGSNALFPMQDTSCLSYPKWTRLSGPSSAALAETSGGRNESINSSHFQRYSRWLKRHNELRSPHRRHHKIVCWHKRKTSTSRINPRKLLQSKNNLQSADDQVEMYLGVK